jgi:hypothetical protein
MKCYARNAIGTFSVPTTRLFSILFFLIVSIWPASGNAQDSLFVKHRVDSLRNTFQTQTWVEKIALLPGQIFYLPVHVLSLGIQKGIQWTDEEKVIPRVKDVLTSDDGKKGLAPKYGSQIGGGLSAYHRSLFHPASKLSLTITGNFDKRQFYELVFQRIRFAKERLQVDVQAFYHYLPEEDVYGIGPFARDRESEYSIAKSVFQSSLGLRTNDRSALLLTAGVQKNRVRQAVGLNDPETIPLAQLIPQSILAPDLLLGSLAFEWNYLGQDHPGHPTHGWEGFFRLATFREMDGTEYGFFKMHADMKRYFNLSYHRALILRTALEITDAMQGRKVPFYFLSSIGRQETLRGFERGRFRDFDSFVTSLEYRYPVSGNLDGLVFIDGGQVAQTITRIDRRAFQITFGFGLRLWNEEGQLASLQLGKSRDGFRLYFNLN